MKTKLLIASIFLTVAPLAWAETVKPTPTALPKSGNLASSLTGGAYGGTPGSWASDPLKQAAAPIGGSVSQIGTSWVAKVFNNSEDTYSANFKVVQLNNRGISARNDYFSVTLQPGKSSERSFSMANGAINANLELSSWKKLGGDKKDGDQPAAEGSDKGADAKPVTAPPANK